MQRLYNPCRACRLEKVKPYSTVFQFHSSSSQRVYLRAPDELAKIVGPKRRKKVQDAQNEWDDKAKRILSGQEKSMLKLLEDRGYIKEIAGDRNELEALLNRKRIGAYVGIDPTGPSLHVGHLVPIMALYWMHMNGFFAVTLLGAATAKFGDPIGRTQSRIPKSMSEATVDMTSMHLQLKKLSKLICNYGEVYGYEEGYNRRRTLERNSVWFNKLSVLDFMKIVKGVRVASLVSRDVYKSRMKDQKGMSFGEFSYALLQGYDWWHMHQRNGVRVQIGGADQLGNIITGIEVIKDAKITNPDPEVRGANDWIPYGFTTPLLTTSGGEKLGKSDGNAIWLDKSMTSTFDLYQYFMRMPDDAVEQLLKLLTFIPLSEIESIMKEHMQDPSKRVAHRRLAYDVLYLVHGKYEAEATKEQHEALFKKHVSIDKLEMGASKSTSGEKTPINHENAPLPRTVLPRSLVIGQPFSRVLYSAGFVKSRLEGQRLVNHQGAYVGSRPGQEGGMLENDLQFTPIKSSFPDASQKYVIGDDLLILRKGKWQVKIISLVSDEEFAKMGQDVPLWNEMREKLGLEKAVSDDGQPEK